MNSRHLSQAILMAAPFDLQLDVSIDVEQIIAAARAAGDVILGVYNGEADSWQVEQKEDNSPLTRADRDANALICGASASRGSPVTCTSDSTPPLAPWSARLQRLAPHIPIVSEENVAVPYEVRKHYQYSWCVDPLDGTKVCSATPVLSLSLRPC